MFRFVFYIGGLYYWVIGNEYAKKVSGLTVYKSWGKKENKFCYIHHVSPE